MRRSFIILGKKPLLSAADGTRYWVGGPGSWSDGDNHWAIVSGGEGNDGYIPNSNCDVVIDANSGFAGGGELWLDLTAHYCKNFTCSSGHTYTIRATNDPPDLIPYGSVTFEAGLTMIGVNLSFSGHDTGRTFNPAGVTQYGVYFYAGGVSLAGNLVVTAFLGLMSTEAEQIFNANGYTVTVNQVLCQGTPHLTLGSGLWTITGGGDYAWVFPSGGTLVSTSSTLKFTSTDSFDKTFDGGGKTYNNVWFAIGASTASIKIYGANTFNDFKVDSPPHTILFEGAKTQTVTTFTVLGTDASHRMTINSIDGSTAHNLSKASGTVTCAYLTLSHSHAGGGATWVAGATSQNIVDNTGWTF
jgi:hypothetical protein